MGVGRWSSIISPEVMVVNHPFAFDLRDILYALVSVEVGRWLSIISPEVMVVNYPFMCGLRAMKYAPRGVRSTWQEVSGIRTILYAPRGVR